jgi:hypothetical protein
MVYSVTMPLHVSRLLVAHHQEVTMYICDSWYVLYVSVDCQRAWVEPHVPIITYIHCYLLPDDGQLAIPKHVRRYIQNIPDWCRHLYSSCGSAKHRYMLGLPCLVSQRAKLHVARWKWAIYTRVYLESCISLSPQSENFWIHPRRGVVTE